MVAVDSARLGGLAADHAHRPLPSSFSVGATASERSCFIPPLASTEPGSSCTSPMTGSPDRRRFARSRCQALGRPSFRPADAGRNRHLPPGLRRARWVDWGRGLAAFRRRVSQREGVDQRPDRRVERGRVLPFSFEVTPYLKDGSNEIKVRVDSPTDNRRSSRTRLSPRSRSESRAGTGRSPESGSRSTSSGASPTM
jgi:hypothetical protein